MRPRSQTYVALGEADLSYCLKTMEGALPKSGYMALRFTSDVISEAKINGVLRREKLPRGPGGTYCGLIILFSLQELAPVAFIHDGYIQVFRVACTSALSARILARQDAGDLGLLGSSGQVWMRLVAMKAARELRRELDDTTMRRAALVVAQLKEVAQAQKHGDLIHPVEAGILKWEQTCNLSDIVAGKMLGRRHRDEITVFKNNVGLGLQFAAVAPRVYELAREAGIGRELPGEWFLETMKP